MSDLVTDAMVEAAARGEWTHERHIRPWEKAPDVLADHCRGCSRNALEAAAPLIAAKVLRDAADEVRNYIYQLDDVSGPFPNDQEAAHLIGVTDAHHVVDRLLTELARRLERGES